MPLEKETRRAIHDYLLVELTRYVKENSKAGEALVTKPFHARLLPTLFNVPLSERSFSTRSGSWWQQLARLVARQYHQRAELCFRVDGQIKPAAAQHIDEILRQLNTPGVRVPGRLIDIAEVQTVQSAGGDTATELADLFVLTHEGREMFFEMKTPQPNKDTSKAMKRFILRMAAIKKGHMADAFAATAYNPFGDGAPYTWNYAVQFLEIGSDILIGRDFWSKIGDGQTYDELLEISEEVGKRITELIAAAG